MVDWRRVRTLSYGLPKLISLVVDRWFVGIMTVPWSLNLMLADLDLLLVLVETLLVQLSRLRVIFVLLPSLEGGTCCRKPNWGCVSCFGGPSN